MVGLGHSSSGRTAGIAIVICLAAAMAPGTAPAAAQIQTLHTFAGGTDGFDPNELTYQGGYLYGTTPSGGSNGNCGIVYRINATSGAEKVLRRFDCGAGGKSPKAGVVFVAGALYGTTQTGGGAGNGIVFKIDAATGAETILHRFTGHSDGGQPQAALIYEGGMLYGTTKTGGAANRGTVFSVNPKTGAESVLYSFKGRADGVGPTAGLIYRNGFLYGVTPAGGASSEGTVFAINVATRTEIILHNFAKTGDGTRPSARLAYIAGYLYGTTLSGGTANKGTIFKIAATTGAETVLHSFKAGVDGVAPIAGLIDVGGYLYGTTQRGGPHGDGTVVKIDTKTGATSVVHAFSGYDGAMPAAGLVQQGGVFYGTTTSGGEFSIGNVFKLTP